MPSKKPEVRKRANDKYRKDHPAAVLLYNRRMCYVRKALYQWMKRNHPELIRQFNKEAMKAYPSWLVDDDARFYGKSPAIPAPIQARS